MLHIIGHMTACMQSMLTNLDTVRRHGHGWKAAAQRVRRNSLEFAQLALQYRKLSIEAEKQARAQRGDAKDGKLS